MSVRVSYYLVCDNCNNQIWANGGFVYGETEADLKEEAGASVHNLRVKNGSFWDFCQKCYDRKVMEDRLEGFS